MIPRKTTKEIKIMREGGQRLRAVLKKVLSEVRPGVEKIHLERIGEKEIKKLGGKPSFMMVEGYSWATCLTVNNEVVHGIPNGQILKNGDILGVDVGIYFQGFHTDLATTVGVGKISLGTQKFLSAGGKALRQAISKAKAGNFVGDLSVAIQKEIEGAGYHPVKVLTGHGVGKKLHEVPAIPCFLKGMVERTPKLAPGMTLAIEVIYNQGSDQVVMEEDGWTISTQDGKISGLFEETVAIMDDGPLILTK